MHISIKNQYSARRREERPLTPRETVLYDCTRTAALGRHEILERKVADLGLSVDQKCQSSWDQFIQKTPDEKYRRQKSRSPLARDLHSRSNKQFNLNLSKFQKKQVPQQERQACSQVDSVLERKRQVTDKENMNIHFGQGTAS